MQEGNYPPVKSLQLSFYMCMSPPLERELLKGNTSLFIKSVSPELNTISDAQ